MNSSLGALGQSALPLTDTVKVWGHSPSNTSLGRGGACGRETPACNRVVRSHRTRKGTHLFLQVVVVAVMQQEAEDIASINHGVNATFLQLLSQPGLHGAQRVEQRHCRGGGRARVSACRACRWQTIHGSCTERAHEFRLLASLKCEAFSGVDVLLVSGGDFHSSKKERRLASRTSIDFCWQSAV